MIVIFAKVMCLKRSVYQFSSSRSQLYPKPYPPFSYFSFSLGATSHHILLGIVSGDLEVLYHRVAATGKEEQPPQPSSSHLFSCSCC